MRRIDVEIVTVKMHSIAVPGRPAIGCVKSETLCFEASQFAAEQIKKSALAATNINYAERSRARNASTDKCHKFGKMFAKARRISLFVLIFPGIVDERWVKSIIVDKATILTVNDAELAAGCAAGFTRARKGTILQYC